MGSLPIGCIYDFAFVLSFKHTFNFKYIGDIMTAALGNTAQGTPFATGVDAFVYPQFLSAMRAPTTQDIYNPGTRWLDASVNPRLIYETTGAGDWDVGGVQPATTTVYGTVILTDNNEPVATKFYADNLAIA